MRDSVRGLVLWPLALLRRARLWVVRRSDGVSGLVANEALSRVGLASGALATVAVGGLILAALPRAPSRPLPPSPPVVPAEAAARPDATPPPAAAAEPDPTPRPTARPDPPPADEGVPRGDVAPPVGGPTEPPRDDSALDVGPVGVGDSRYVPPGSEEVAGLRVRVRPGVDTPATPGGEATVDVRAYWIHPTEVCVPDCSD